VLGDVHVRAEHAGDVSGRVPQGQLARQQRQQLAVGRRLRLLDQQLGLAAVDDLAVVALVGVTVK
jgi:hypothetical protein